MSSQRGNNSRTRPQKHKNKTSFKNTLHDTSHRTKLINNIVVSEVCQRCKEVIEWKIKYKKYKPLTQPKKCVKCEQKTVKQAYHVMCLDCGRKLGVCTKCCKAEGVVHEVEKEEQMKLDAEMQALLQSLPERKRRTFIRYMKKQTKECSKDEKEQKDNLAAKLNSLKVEGNEDDSDDFDLDDLSDEEEAVSDENNESGLILS